MVPVGVEAFWERMTWQLIRNTLRQNGEDVRKTVKRQLNVRWSLLDYFHEDRGMEERMNQVRKELKQHLTTKEEWDFSSKDVMRQGRWRHICWIYRREIRSRVRGSIVFWK